MDGQRGSDEGSGRIIMGDAEGVPHYNLPGNYHDDTTFRIEDVGQSFDNMQAPRNNKR